MLAISIIPGEPGSLKLEEMPEPAVRAGDLLVESLAVGVCGTDRELIAGVYGEAPKGEGRLVLGHESLGRVLAAPAGSGFSKGDRVVGIVRHPDPLPCANCAAGEWDMCANGGYTERGIKQAHGFASERFAIDASMAVKVEKSLGLAAVLLEPASVLAKAWEHIDAIGRRATWTPRRVLVIGAGPVGLMAALMGVQRGLQVDVQDHNESVPKPALVEALGARYFSRPAEGPYDVVLECTGVPEVIAEVLGLQQPNLIICLTGISAARSAVKLDAAPFNQAMVLNNQVVFGSVNANRRHYQAGADALARADRGWLDALLTRKVALGEWRKAYDKDPGGVKTVLNFAN